MRLVLLCFGCVAACSSAGAHGTGDLGAASDLAATPDPGDAMDLATVDGALPAPAWATQLVAGDEPLFALAPNGGTITFGVADPLAVDNAVATLRFPGDASLQSTDHVGPGFAAEIDSQRTFLYGIFRARLQQASCSSSEDVINGNFTYFNDGSDLNNNGLPDNAEIDIEIPCGTPQMISLTSWTDYDEASGKFIKWSRAIDTSTGDFAESVADNVYDQAPKGNSPDFVIPGFAAGGYYEMGFEWRATKLRFFLVAGGREITLWDSIDPKYIPQRAGQWIFNVWHPATHWFAPGGSANYPAHDATMKLDWARYWP